MKENAEDNNLKKNNIFEEINKYTLEISDLPYDKLFPYAAQKIKDIFKIKEVFITSYNEKESILTTRYTTLSDEENANISKIIGNKLIGMTFPVSAEMHTLITTALIKKSTSISDVTFGKIPDFIGKALEKSLNLEWFLGVALMQDKKLMGTMILVGGKNQEMPDTNQLISFVKITTLEIARKKANQELEQSDKRFHNALEISPIPTAICKNDGSISFINTEFTKTFGYTLTDIPTLDNWYSLAYPDIAYRNFVIEEWGESIKQAIASNTPILDKNINIQCKNGEVKNIITSASIENDIIIVLFQDITSIKQTEELILKSEAIKYKMISNISDVIVIIDEHAINRYKSPNITKLFGWKPEELIGKSAWDNVHSDDLEAAQKFLYTIASEPNASGTTQVRYKHKNGNYVWIEITITNLFHDNDIKGLLGNYKEITERKLAKTALEEAEWKFKALFEKGPIGVAYHVMVNNAEGNPIDYFFLDANNAYLELTGVDPRGKLVTEAFPGIEKDPFDWIGVFGKVARTGETLRFQQYLEPNQRWYDVVGYQYKPDHFVAAFIEITEQKKSEIQLLETNEKLNAINTELSLAKEKAEESEQQLLHKNAEITLNNERLESLLKISQFPTDSIQELLDFALNEAITLTQSKIGYIYFYSEEKKEFTLNTWSKDVMKECTVMNPQTVYSLEKTGMWGEAVRQRKTIIINEFEAPHPHKKGMPEGHVKLSKFLTIPVFSLGKIVAVAGVANKETDYDSLDVRQLTLLMDSVWKISERIALIDDLKKTTEKAEESDRLKTAFLQNMSHEIRTPMNAIMGFSSLLPYHFNEKEKLVEFSKIINQRCSDLLDIINDILDISKIESGQSTMHVEECNLQDLCTELTLFFKDYQTRTKKEHIQFILQPHSESELIIKTEKTRLKQILINLISNAFKFTETGSVTCGCEIINDKLKFFVSDTGVGVPKEKFDYIFERFAQLNNTNNLNIGGTGLGLPIVKALANLLGGEVWLESEENKGTTFYFTIAYNPCEVEQKPINIQAINTNEFYTNKKVLIVEDDMYNMMYLSEVLKNHVEKIFKVTNGTDAIDFVANNNIDIILMDIQLPDITGYQATQEILKQKPNTIIIAQTAYAAQNDRNKALAHGCKDYVSKPTDSEKLLSIIRKYAK